MLLIYNNHNNYCFLKLSSKAHDNGMHGEYHCMDLPVSSHDQLTIVAMLDRRSMHDTGMQYVYGEAFKFLSHVAMGKH